MARNGQSWAIRTTFLTGGPQSGTTSSTLCFDTTAGPATIPTVNTLLADVKTFFLALAQYYGPQVSRGANLTESAAYDLDLADIHHAFGSPVTLLMWTMGTSTNLNPLPNEMAAALSIRADYGTDPEHGGTTRPRADDRGRIYVGPLNLAAVSAASTPLGLTYAVVDPGFVTAMSNAITALKSAASGHGFDLAVWSRKNAILKDAIFKSVDNSFDVQRRREVEPPGVHTWTII